MTMHKQSAGWAVIALCAVLLVLFHESLFLGKGLVPTDGIFQSLPWSRTSDAQPSNYLLADQYKTFIPQHHFVHQRIRGGEFPLWNPHLACGVPNLASIQGALLFPIQLLLSPLTPFYASGVAAFLKLFLAGTFAILYLRRLGASPAASFLSGLCFSLCGFMVVWLGHPHVNSAMWLPLLLYYLEGQFCAPPRPRQWAAFAVAFAFMILGGHPPTAVHVTIVIVCYFVYRLAGAGTGRRVQLGAGLIGSLCVGALLAAPQLLPYLEYYRESSSPLSSLALDRWESHLPLSSLVYFILPHISGTPVAGYEDLTSLLGLGEVANFNERTAYFGIVPLFFSLCAVVLRRCRFTCFFLAVAAFSLLVVWGLPPFPEITRLTPVLRDINHTRLLLLVAFSGAVLAGLGFDAAFGLERGRRLNVLLTAFWGAVGGVLWWLAVLTYRNAPLLDHAHRMFLIKQLPVVVCGLIVPAVALFRPLRMPHRVAIILCLGWTSCDLVLFARGYNPSVSHDRYYPHSGVIDFLKKDNSRFRIMGLNDVIVPNTAEVYGLNDARGNDFMTIRRYEELISGTAGDFSFYDAAPSLPDVFSMLNVKYVVAPGPIAVDPGQFELVYANEVAVYRYRQWLERSLVLFNYRVCRTPAEALQTVRDKSFDPRALLVLEEEPEHVAATASTAGSGGTTRIREYGPDTVTMDASMPRPGFLLLLDTYFPGWVAWVNGNPARIYRADYNFRAVSLPAGPSTIRFAYRPASVRSGTILSLIGLILLISLFLDRSMLSGMRSALHISRKGALQSHNKTAP